LAMRCATTHHDIWEEFYQVGLDLQNHLHWAQTLHSNDGLRLIYVLGPLPFLSTLSYLQLSLSFLLAAPADGGCRDGLLYRRLAR
jgi:hypothetical protein